MRQQTGPLVTQFIGLRRKAWWIVPTSVLVMIAGWIVYNLETTSVYSCAGAAGCQLQASGTSPVGIVGLVALWSGAVGALAFGWLWLASRKAERRHRGLSE